MVLNFTDFLVKKDAYWVTGRFIPAFVDEENQLEMSNRKNIQY